MSQNDHTHNNNYAAFAAELLLCVWPSWDIGHERVNYTFCGNIIYKKFKNIYYRYIYIADGYIASKQFFIL